MDRPKPNSHPFRERLAFECPLWRAITFTGLLAFVSAGAVRSQENYSGQLNNDASVNEGSGPRSLAPLQNGADLRAGSAPMSGSLQQGVQSNGYSPETISGSPTGRGQTNLDARRLTTEPEYTGRPRALYARPSAVPGQFELLERPAPAISEFERFVDEKIGRPLPRFGSSLILNSARGFTTPPTTTVPPDYTLNPGDELLVGVTGSVEADLRLIIDSEGRIFVPKIGAINVAGIKYGDLQAALARRFSEQYKQARVSVVIARLHGINIYVTGYAVSPGAYTVSSLSTMVDAVLSAGGPAAGGSFRTVELRRGGRLITTLDLYDLLLKGDKSNDALLQNGDVLNIAPAHDELAVIGSVNAEAIYEAKPGETLGDVIRYAGGPSSLADDTRIFVNRLADQNAQGVIELSTSQAHKYPAERGDIVRITARAPLTEPLERQAIVATIEGEVNHPGRYYFAPGATMADLLARSGGLTAGAFIYGSQINRESIRLQQQKSFDQAIDNLEVAADAAPLGELGVSADRQSVESLRAQSTAAIIRRLKARKPNGRLILDLAPSAVALPVNLALEDNDRIFVPARPTSVGVFGAVYEPASFIFRSGARIGDYLKQAGGAQRYGDEGDVFVVRANGSVLSRRQDHGLERRYALQGDLIFVPVKVSASGLQRLLDIATLVFQFGVGAAALKAVAS